MLALVQGKLQPFQCLKETCYHFLTVRRIWLSDLSSQLPETSQLDGLDISFKATPPAEWLPSNLKLRRWDVREPVPEDLVEKYDFVHVRFFSFVLRNEEISEVAENIVRLISRIPLTYLQ